jgi:hypothetical protein
MFQHILSRNWPIIASLATHVNTSSFAGYRKNSYSHVQNHEHILHLFDLDNDDVKPWKDAVDYTAPNEFRRLVIPLNIVPAL